MSDLGAWTSRAPHLSPDLENTVARENRQRGTGNIGVPEPMNQRVRQLLLLLFVGERPSLRAAARGWTLTDGRLAGKTLHDAVRALGLDPTRQAFRNLWRSPEPCATDAWHQARTLAAIRRELGARGGLCPLLVVGLGRKVCRVLRDAAIPHVELVHPAARGRIRKGRRYAAHVRRRLGRHLPFPHDEGGTT